MIFNTTFSRRIDPLYPARSGRVFSAAVLVALAGLWTPGTAQAQSGANVLLVINQRYEASEEIGSYYARNRAIPVENVVRIAVDSADDIDRAGYEQNVEGPIAAALARRAGYDRILYLVLTKGVPLRIKGSAGRDGTTASVDSELTLLYRKLTGQTVSLSGRVDNPYFLSQARLGDARRFTHEHQDIFLVSRLDGFTVADVIRMIDAGIRPSREGKIVLDGKATLVDRGGDSWLDAAGRALREQGWGDDRVVHDTSRTVLSGVSPVLGYYSWGSNDPGNRLRHLDMGFVPGAIAATFVSTDARTFIEPPADWKIGSWENPRTFFLGSPQSLIGDLIREGATGVAGHVSEPYLDATIRPQILFPAYMAGFNLVESFYLAMPFLSWQTVVVGDPLCAPFRTQSLTEDQIERGTDPETEWPKYFSTRRVDALAKRSPSRQAIALTVRAEAQLARADVPAARVSLEEATRLDNQLLPAHLALASLYEAAGDVDQAIDRYRKIVAISPTHAVSLNNLAYALAVPKASPEKALPYAEKAYALSRDNPLVADTIGWIYHLLGQNDAAAKFLGEAVRGAPSNPDVHLHAARVDLSLGRLEGARTHVKQALSFDPTIVTRDDVISLQKDLEEP